MNSKFFWFIILFAVNLLVGCGKSSADTAATGDTITTQPPVVTQSGASCGEIPLPHRPLQYCFEDRAGQATNAQKTIPVIYYFHGLGGSVDDLFTGNNKYLLEALEQAYGDSLPVIVSLSLGNDGVMGDEASAIASVALAKIDQFIAPAKRFAILTRCF